jgi:hypothetical protein
VGAFEGLVEGETVGSLEGAGVGPDGLKCSSSNTGVTPATKTSEIFLARDGGTTEGRGSPPAN